MTCSFNPRPHAAGDLPASRLHAPRAVSIHARTRRATQACGLAFAGGIVFQSTPARGGRRRARASKCWRLRVSIHARTRRATRRRAGPLAGCSVCFNPRPHAAGDASVRGTRMAARMFQSTPARGGRLRPPGRRRSRHAVSIHARTRRATPVRRHCGTQHSFNPRPHAAGDDGGVAGMPPSECFNPRPHAAGDQFADAFAVRIIGFNPRPHAAGDPVQRLPCMSDASCFNPRPHAAGDRRLCDRLRPGCHVSIHARTRRATSPSNGDATTCQMFQSTPARGGRPSAQPPAAAYATFQSTPARGGRLELGARAWSTAQAVSIHARTRRATHCRCSDLGGSQCFNPRPHAAGDQS